MNGAWILAADLVRLITGEVRVSFVWAASYDTGTAGAETVQVSGLSSLRFGDESVVLVEDIVDTGRTMRTLVSRLVGAGAGRVRVCALLSNPTRRDADVPIDFLGFEMRAGFVVGYGMDYRGAYRNLPDVRVLRDSE